MQTATAIFIPVALGFAVVVWSRLFSLWHYRARKVLHRRRERDRRALVKV
jgi:hypothetical protein